MKKIASRLKENFNEKQGENEENGDLLQTILLSVLFVGLAAALSYWIWTIVSDKTEEINEDLKKDPSKDFGSYKSP